MRIRLAMSLAIIIRPDVLLADEIFAVGVWGFSCEMYGLDKVLMCSRCDPYSC